MPHGWRVTSESCLLGKLCKMLLYHLHQAQGHTGIQKILRQMLHFCNIPWAGAAFPWRGLRGMLCHKIFKMKRNQPHWHCNLYKWHPYRTHTSDTFDVACVSTCKCLRCLTTVQALYWLLYVGYMMYVSQGHHCRFMVFVLWNEDVRALAAISVFTSLNKYTGQWY